MYQQQSLFVDIWNLDFNKVLEKRERMINYRKIKNNHSTDYSQLLEGNQECSKVNTLQRPNMKKNLLNNSSSLRLPRVSTNTCHRTRNEKDDGNFTGRKKWNTQKSLSREFSRQMSTTDMFSPGSRGFNARNRILCPSKNRISFPLMSSVDRRMLDSFGSYEAASSNMKRKDFFLSDSALAIRSIELKPRQTRKEHKTKTPPKTPDESETKFSDPIFPSLSGSKNIEPLYMYSSPLFSLSDDVESLAPFLDGISLSPPPPSELSFSSPSQSPLYFSPCYDFLD